MMTFLLRFLIGAFIGWPIVCWIMLRRATREAWSQGYSYGRLTTGVAQQKLAIRKEMNNDE